MPRERDEQSLNAVTRASLFLGHFRWAFMPIGLAALVAVGIHAAADVVDERLLRVIDWADGLFDRLWASWSVTAPLVDWVGLEGRTFLARSLTLIWELWADALMVLSVVGYRERAPSVAMARGGTKLGDGLAPWVRFARKTARAPTLRRIVYPLATAAWVLAGSCAVAQMIEGGLYLSLRDGVASQGVAAALARLSALGTLGLLLGRLGWRAVLRNFEAADAKSDARGVSGLRLGLDGLVPAVVLAPLALAAFLDATPLLSFFRAGGL